MVSSVARVHPESHKEQSMVEVTKIERCIAILQYFSWDAGLPPDA